MSVALYSSICLSEVELVEEMIHLIGLEKRGKTSHTHRKT